jgi:hypothetical protein
MATVVFVAVYFSGCDGVPTATSAMARDLSDQRDCIGSALLRRPTAGLHRRRPLPALAGRQASTPRRRRGKSGNQKRRRSRPVSRVLSWTTIPLGAASPQRSSSTPGCGSSQPIAPLFGLAPSGVCRAPRRWPRGRWALTPPFHHHHAHLAMPFGCLLSVALSVASRRPGVTWHSALWSPDFPRRGCPRRGCLGRLRLFHCRRLSVPPARGAGLAASELRERRAAVQARLPPPSA